MLEFAHHPNRPTLRLLLLHDDAEREFDYRVGAEQALSQAEADGWTVVSIKSLGHRLCDLDGTDACPDNQSRRGTCTGAAHDMSPARNS